MLLNSAVSQLVSEMVLALASDRTGDADDDGRGTGKHRAGGFGFTASPPRDDISNST